ncbi:hypothetical protein [Sutcliffiella halmapala]|uniref:hypothetical protein n=1 Tax=Sutcliffiella halmapala TaxID=79882 RepID=UPI00099509F1|nr:hypothetical protein [Sutcliffiella halmapala]
MVKACIGCQVGIPTILRRGFEIIRTDSNDIFTQDILKKYGHPFLGSGAICNSCLKEMAKEDEYLVPALLSPLMKDKF